MKKIIITGATSMLGTALIEVAIRENSEVYAVVRPDSNKIDRIISSPLVHVVYASLENLNEIDGLPFDCDVFAMHEQKHRIPGFISLILS